MGAFCEGDQSTCEGDCKGVWCPSASALLQHGSSKQKALEKAVRAKSHSTCYISECGCPPFTDGPSWCSGKSAKNGEYCQQSEENCFACNGYWYAGDGAPGSTCNQPSTTTPPTTTAPPETPTMCWNSACGCPPFTDGASWCSNVSGTMGAFCEGDQSTCEGECKGVWCGSDASF